MSRPPGTEPPARLIARPAGRKHPFEQRAHKQGGAMLVSETARVVPGLVLVETGLGDIERPEQSLGRTFLDRTAAILEPGETPVHQIARLGYSPKDVRPIVLTHLDLDHTGRAPRLSRRQGPRPRRRVPGGDGHHQHPPQARHPLPARALGPPPALGDLHHRQPRRLVRLRRHRAGLPACRLPAGAPGRAHRRPLRGGGAHRRPVDAARRGRLLPRRPGQPDRGWSLP